MNIVFALHDPSVFRHFEEVIRRLCGLGHQVKVLHGNAYSDKSIVVDSALETCNFQLSNFETIPMLSRKKWLRMSNVREMVDYANYLRPQHPTPWEARRWRRKILFKPVSKALKYSNAANKLIANHCVFNLLKWFERRIPPDPDILQWLKINRPDVVVSSPYILPRTGEIEYIQAALALQIPTIAIVLSWDNLTTKGTFHIIPDAVFVWNTALAEEATAFHDVPRDNIIIIGAPVFDFWFETQPSLDFDNFTIKTGIGANQPYVLYLCSSKYISGDETSFVRAFATALHDNQNSAHIRVMVRPHPLNSQIWDGFEDQNIVIWPKDPSWVDTTAAKQDYYNSIYHSTAVVGVNTSAFLEAAIMDKPCVTILMKQYGFKQSKQGHFRHLLNGDFLEVAHSFAKAASVIAEIIADNDRKKEQRQRFVHDFIRPCGLDQSVSEIMTKAIEIAALRKDFQQCGYN
jgi:hypothetical protein